MSPADPAFVEQRVREIAAFERRAAGEVPHRTKISQPHNGANTMSTPVPAVDYSPSDAPLPAAPRQSNVSLARPHTVSETSFAIVQEALRSGNIEIYREAVALAKEMDAIAARKAFDAAMAEAKARITVIKKNRQVGFDSRKPGAGRTDYAYEDLGEIARTIDPVLGELGLSYRWRTSSDINQPVVVTCIIAHRDGHSEETTLRAGRDDDNSNKNSLQRIGSTITYLQRYTLKAALGLAASKDDDGRASEPTEAEAAPAPGTISAEQADQIRNALADNNIAERAFLQFVRLSRIEDIGAEHFDRAMAKIKSFRRQS